MQLQKKFYDAHPYQREGKVHGWMNQQGEGHIYVSQWHQHGDNMRDDQVYT